MSNLVIVAIPDENDRVWKVSSEKVPHLTVLFLGDTDEVKNLETIVQFVEHAASQTLRRFYLPVDRRGELGNDPELGPADVLFFKKGRYDYKAIRDFRAALLQDNNIKTAHDSAQQHEGPWIPHLTLGYENRPAKPDETDRDYGFFDVCFNKIAVWVDDYDGPEYLLKDYWDEYDALETVPMDVAMSALHPIDDVAVLSQRGAEFMAHYGVKGMKWGVRQAETRGSRWDPEGHSLGKDAAAALLLGGVPGVGLLTIPAHVRLARGAARGTKAKLLDRQEKQFEKKAMSAKNFVKIHNGSVDQANRELTKLNKAYEGKDLTKDTEARKKYDADVIKIMQDAYRQSANSITNKANTRHLDVEFSGDGMDVKITAQKGPGTQQPERVKHAATDEEDEVVTFHAKIVRNDVGHILGFVFDDFDQGTEAQHAIDLGATLVSSLLDGEALEHYGIKGMRWGVRRRRDVTTETHLDTGLRKRQTKVRAAGGEAHPAHTDAVKAAVAKQIVKKSGTDALSTQDLRELANRLQVENQVSLLMSSKGKKFVQGQLEQEGKNALKKGAKSAAPHVLKKARRTAATVATTAALV
jgi:2'-5' RNA ligase